jgi:hypothetical protein
VVDTSFGPPPDAFKEILQDAVALISTWRHRSIKKYRHILVTNAAKSKHFSVPLNNSP